MIRNAATRTLPLFVITLCFCLMSGDNSLLLTGYAEEGDKTETESITTPRMPENPKPFSGDIDHDAADSDDEEKTADDPLDSCEIYSGHVNWLGSGKIHGTKVAHKMLNITKKGSGLTCLKNILNIIGDRCDKKGRYKDDCYASTLLQHDKDDIKFIYKKLPKNISRNYICLKRTGDKGHTKDDCVIGYFFFDKKCRPVKKKQVTELCGSLDVVPKGMNLNFIESSPISLLWSDNSSIDAQLSFVRFSLNPGISDSWYEWRASSETPLLVYDPNHNGKITSATQLFGNWTFGGRKLASRDASSSVKGGPWKNGYQALSTMDGNLDGKISGKELAPLALWFDYNQDAVSQQGEVKSLTQVGVTELFYQPDHTDKVSGNIYATRGYTRILDGKAVQGSSVDWFARSADTQFELITHNTFSSTLSTEPMVGDYLEDEQPKTTSVAKLSGPEIGGRWVWDFDAMKDQAVDKENPHGYLVLDDSRENNEVRGYSFVERGFKKSPGNELGSLASVFRLQGSKVQNKAGDIVLKFTSRGIDQVIRSEAIVAEGGRVLLGKSTVQLLVNGRNKKVQYTWRADKL